MVLALLRLAAKRQQHSLAKEAEASDEVHLKLNHWEEAPEELLQISCVVLSAMPNGQFLQLLKRPVKIHLWKGSIGSMLSWCQDRPRRRKLRIEPS